MRELTAHAGARRPTAGEALSALCDQLHRGSVWCVMVRFVTGLYTAIIHCG